MLRRRLTDRCLAALPALMALVVSGFGSRPALAAPTTYTAYHTDIGWIPPPPVICTTTNVCGTATGLAYQYIRGNVPLSQELQGSATLTFAGALASGIRQATDSYSPGELTWVNNTVSLTGDLYIEVGTLSSGTQYAVWLFDFVPANGVHYEVQVGFPWTYPGDLSRQGEVTSENFPGSPDKPATITFPAPGSQITQFTMKITGYQKGSQVLYWPFPGPVNFEVTTW